MQSKATTVEQYLAELPDDRREALQALRQVILENIDGDFEEGMQYGLPGFYVPHRVYPAGYHCDPKIPLPFVGMASQKHYMSLYLMCVYDQERVAAFRRAWAKTGKKLDMGKCCIRFKKLEQLALGVIGDTIRRTTAKKYIAAYEAQFAGHRQSPARSTKKTVKPTKTARPARSPQSPRKAKRDG